MRGEKHPNTRTQYIVWGAGGKGHVHSQCPCSFIRKFAGPESDSESKEEEEYERIRGSDERKGNGNERSNQ